ncbi:PRC-barrel domain-containing protein [Cognatishimia sp. SS12]|uniref:PRC-barrel domain-containing protein n=1 Tax=Cognatishimia sp. SS12 TaxID=2979465 RepID=UPI00232C34D3|nr:PRC-barrel domain-containing protein [Cognatishimia sp. SS12]MDC0737771.1 PRC-barrel domain-containing protein [Cognatishimia sp. SS12]
MTIKNTLLTTAAILSLSGAAIAGTEAATSASATGDAMIETNDTGVSADTMASVEGEASVDADSGDAGTTKLKTGTATIAAAEAEGDVNGKAKYDAFVGMTVAEILGMEVESQGGEIVGEIDYVVKADDGYSAVIGIGGFLGLGEYTVSLPLENFELQDSKLKLNSETEAELKAMPEVDESELNELDGDFIIS